MIVLIAITELIISIVAFSNKFQTRLILLEQLPKLGKQQRSTLSLSRTNAGHFLSSDHLSARHGRTCQPSTGLSPLLVSLLRRRRSPLVSEQRSAQLQYVQRRLFDAHDLLSQHLHGRLGLRPALLQFNQTVHYSLSLLVLVHLSA